MENKTVFIKTKKGEDEMQGRTTHLPGDIKRALLMVDGDLTFAEIRKRAAPSLRSSLDQLFQELVKGGYIHDKSQAQGQARSGNIPRMSVPVKMATPQKNKAANINVGELDFMGGFPLEPSDVPAAGSAKAAMLKAEAQENIEREVEAAQYSAQHEAEAILFQAEQEKARQERDAARLKAEQEARARQENAEKARRQAERLKEEQEALQVRIKLDAARQRAEQEARNRIDATAQAQAGKDAEAARVREEAQRIVRLAQEAREREEQALKATRAREEADRIARLERETKEREEQERQVREEAERIVRLEREAREREEQERQVREEAERIVRLEREAREREEQERRMREEAERIVRLEREARELEEQARKAREEAERIVRLEREEQARKAREEAERVVRLEREAKELEAQERKAARVREEVQRLLSQEQQERETRPPDLAMPESGEASGEWGLFSFDTFQVDEPLYTSESHIERNPANKEAPPAQPARPAAASPAGKSGTFAFDAFQVDEPQLPVEKSGAGQPATPAETAPPAQVNGPPPAAGKAGKVKPDQEQVRRAKQEQQRKAAEAQQAKQISEAQARVWAEAEQRALETAREEVEQAGRHAAIAVADVPAARPAPLARARRKQFSWGKLAGVVFRLGLLLLVLIIGALFIVPYVVSTREYLPKAEQLLSTKLHQPVHVGSLSGRILPTPRLELGEIYIGDAKQLQVKVAQINFSFTGLFTDVKPVNSIEFQDIKVRGAWLTDVSGWMQKMAGEERYPVSRMSISNGTLDADVFELDGIEGDLNFDPNGKFTRGDLHANGGKYDLGISAAPASKLDIALTVRNSALPLLPNWTFDTLTAKGELNNGELVIGNFDAQMFGGAVQGNADLNWRSGWIAQGTLSAKGINMQKLSKLLDGNVDGSARFRMAAADLGRLAGSATLDGNFNSSDGTISGLEIADTARKLSRENLPGGRTHYDGLAGNFSFDNGVYHFKQAKITASGLSALATFDADTARQQLSGKIGVTLSLPARTAPVELMLGGAIDSPTLVYAP